MDFFYQKPQRLEGSDTFSKNWKKNKLLTQNSIVSKIFFRTGRKIKVFSDEKKKQKT